MNSGTVLASPMQSLPPTWHHQGGKGALVCFPGPEISMPFSKAESKLQYVGPHAYTVAAGSPTHTSHVLGAIWVWEPRACWESWPGSSTRGREELKKGLAKWLSRMVLTELLAQGASTTWRTRDTRG